MCECASGLPFHYSEMTIFEPISFSIFGSFWILFFGTDLKSAHLFRRTCFPAFGFIQKSMSWPVCTVPGSAAWASAKWFARCKALQMQTSAVRRMVYTVGASAEWFALRDSMRTTSSPNLNHSCNENGCEKITKSAQIQS